MIIDSHGHTFPFVGDTSGFSNPRDHFDLLQFELNQHRQPMRRTSDNALVPHDIWSPTDRSPNGRYEFGFRVGQYGRFEWTKDGVDYYKQYLPPACQDNSASAEWLIAEMDYAGVDMAVVQYGLTCGMTNDYFGECIRRFPGRFLATAHIDERTWDTDEAVKELHRATEVLGQRALWVEAGVYWLDGFKRLPDHPDFERFWTEVERLDLVAYWDHGASPETGRAAFFDSAKRWHRILERHPRLRIVGPHGLPGAMLWGKRESLPGGIRQMIDDGRFCIEVSLPIARGGVEEYPYPASQDAVHYLYDQCGPRGLVWGSDTPNVLRHCTMRQSLDYLRLYANFIPADDMQLILGGNLERLFKVTKKEIGTQGRLPVTKNAVAR